jgi:hypothetical protein
MWITPAAIWVDHGAPAAAIGCGAEEARSGTPPLLPTAEREGQPRGKTVAAGGGYVVVPVVDVALLYTDEAELPLVAKIEVEAEEEEANKEPVGPADRRYDEGVV